MKKPTSPAVKADIQLADIQRRVTDLLLEHCRQRQRQAQRIAPSYGRLWHGLANLVEAGGKRLRPYMFLLAYRAAGGRRPLGDVLPLAAAWELLHLGLLAHDDIIDRDDIRHGRPNLNGEYWEHYAGLTDPDTRRHASYSAALLGGDLLLTETYELILSVELPAETRIAVCRRLGAAFYAEAAGELLDSEAAFEPVTAVNPELIAEYKTAAYSFIGPLQSGAELAEAPQRTLELLGRYGRAAGIGYQLADDLLGVFGDSSVTGKSTDSDLQEAKRTAVLVHGLELMGDSDRRTAETILAKSTPLGQEDIEELRRLLQASGVAGKLRRDLVAYREAAGQAVLSLGFDTPYQTALNELARRATRRDR